MSFKASIIHSSGVSVLDDRNDDEEEVQDSMRLRHRALLVLGSNVGALSRSIASQSDLDGLKGTRRSRTTARSESSTSPTTTNHRPAIESSSSSTPLASSMMEHIDGDLLAM